MKKLITIALLLLVVIACKEKKTESTSSKELSMTDNDMVQEKETQKDINSKIPTSYAFDFKLTVEAEANGKKIDIHYMVRPEATYYGMVMVLSKKDFTRNSITIMDIGRNKSITLRNRKDNKVLRIIDIPEVEEDANQHISIVRTNTKNILGYACQGYKISTNDGTNTLYITQDASFGFNRGFGSTTKVSLKGKGIDAAIIEELEKGLMIESEFKSNGNNPYVSDSKIIVKEITKLSFTVDLSEYKTIGS